MIQVSRKAAERPQHCQHRVTDDNELEMRIHLQSDHDRDMSESGNRVARKLEPLILL